MYLNPEHLLTFVRVARLGSLSAAQTGASTIVAIVAHSDRYSSHVVQTE